MTYAFIPKQIEAPTRCRQDQIRVVSISYKPIKPTGMAKNYNRDILRFLLKAYEIRKFNNIAAKYLEETSITSSPTMMTRKSSFADIIAMGDVAKQQILQRMASGEVRLAWVIALQVLTGQNPIPQSSTGIINEMGEYWLSWGRDQGII